MKRSGFQRKPLVRQPDTTARLTVRPKKCKACKAEFFAARPMQTVCSPACAHTLVAKRAAKEAEQQRLAEVRKDKARREALQTRGEWIKRARKAVNKYCRLRDIAAGRGCITCGARPETRFGGAFDAGHWRSVGSAPQLQFLTSQIRLQCVKCNRYGAGRAIEFRMALVAERGEAWVQAIEAANHTAKFSIDYLKRLTAIFAEKARRMEKRIA